MLEPIPAAVPSSARGRLPALTAGALAMASGGSALGGLPRSARPALRPRQAQSAQSAGRQLTADEAVTQLYTSHYRSLVRLAALLVRDEPTAEEVVQECFIAMHDGWHRLRDKDKALGYLKRAVVNRCRSVLRHRGMMQRNAPKPAPDMPSAEQDAMSLLERSAVIAALKALPDRQRQALVLRFYADLSEAQIAKTMGISQGAVKSHTARGTAALRTVLEQIA
jgi:RNA polymerase sigma-70 factor (sigma-E family)